MPFSLMLCVASSVLFNLLAGAWLVVPMLFGSPWVPTRRERVRAALRLADLKADEKLYDLGAGDGRVLLLAAREFGARGVGIEISPLHCLAAWTLARLTGLRNRIAIRWQNFLRADVREADVVYLYLTAGQMTRLKPILSRQLRPGARVVTIAQEFQGWQASAWDRERLIFLYQMPPSFNGRDETSLPG